MIQIIPALIIAPAFIERKIEFGVITQSAIAFSTLVAAFSLIVTQFQSLSSFAAVVARLSALVEAVGQPGETATIEGRRRRPMGRPLRGVQNFRLQTRFALHHASTRARHERLGDGGRSPPSTDPADRGASEQREESLHADTTRFLRLLLCSRRWVFLATGVGAQTPRPA